MYPPFLVFLVAVVSGHLIPRDASTFLSDLATVGTNLDTLATKVNAFPATNPNLIQAFAVHTAADAVDTSVKKASSDGKNVPPLSAATTDQVYASFHAETPKIVGILATLVSKKAGFQSLASTPIVQSDLANLYNSTKALEDTTHKLTPGSDAKFAPDFKQINDAFEAAITAFK